MQVNWTRISDAVTFYTTLGFEYVETPVYVDNDTAMITCPRDNAIVHTSHKRVQSNNRVIDQSLVGSAEQGFLQLAKHGNLPNVNYVSAGPCFREEPVYDELHHSQFFKVELFVRCKSNEEAAFGVQEVISRAWRFMQEQTDDPIKLVDEGHGWDLQLNGIEVGSYGYRYHDQIGWWIYGTGIAEPRFTQAMNKQVN